MDDDVPKVSIMGFLSSFVFNWADDQLLALSVLVLFPCILVEETLCFSGSEDLLCAICALRCLNTGLLRQLKVRADLGSCV